MQVAIIKLGGDFMWLFDIFKRKKEKKADEATTHTSAFHDYNPLSVTLKDLWHNGTEEQWQKALDAYYVMLRPEQRDIENYINNIDAETVKSLDENEFYEFLYDKYFVWKYTAKNRLATTRKSLEKYHAYLP